MLKCKRNVSVKLIVYKICMNPYQSYELCIPYNTKVNTEQAKAQYL